MINEADYQWFAENEGDNIYGFLEIKHKTRPITIYDISTPSFLHIQELIKVDHDIQFPYTELPTGYYFKSFSQEVQKQLIECSDPDKRVKLVWFENDFFDV